MIWAILIGLLVYVLIGLLLVNWAVGDFTLTASFPGEMSLLVAFWPFALRFFWRVYFFRGMMQRQIGGLQEWAESGEQKGDGDGRDH